MKKWNLRAENISFAKNQAKDWGIPLSAAAVLQARGVSNVEEFFSEDTPLSDPFQMADMRKAVDRILEAIEGFERIAVYGDYDADGITATAIVYEYLESCGADVIFYIPERDGEGYGLNCDAIRSLHEQNVSLIITVDNGISCISEIEYASTLGVDVVVTDHHQPLEKLPDACAVVDPHRKDCCSTCKDLSGVGVAFKLVMALEGPECDEQSLLENYSDFVALGTIGDIVPLRGENRILVRKGLELLNRTNHPGLYALLCASGLEGKHITSETAAYILVPRINATGRMGSPVRALQLLLTEDEEEAEELAAVICGENERRKATETKIFSEVLELLQREPERLLKRVLVVTGEDWHPGVIGIVAARLAEKFGKPSFVISCCGQEARGSGRSVGDFSLFEAVCSCEELLTKYGGHPMAAGISLPVENIAAFQKKINQYAARHKTPLAEITVDCLLSLNELTVELPRELSCMEPFGADNTVPLFGLWGMNLREITPVGGGKHLRLLFEREGQEIRCMRFGVSPEAFGYQVGDSLDLIVSLENRIYQGVETLSIQIRELRPAGMDTGNLLLHVALYERVLRKEPLSEAQMKILFPTREDFALLYRYLKIHGFFYGSCDLLSSRLPEIPLSRLLFCLDVLQERGLVSYGRRGEEVRVSLLPVSQKVDLFASPWIQIIQSLSLKKPERS